MIAIMRRPIVYVAGAAAFVALLVIARPVIDPAAMPASQPSNASVTSGKLPVVPVVDLKLERLNAPTTDLPDSERDPFRFRPKPPPPAPRVQAAPAPVFAPLPSGPPPPAPIALKYFGFMSMGGQRVASFIDARGNTFTGKEGDIIEGRYRLLRIGADSVEMAYLDGRGQQTIRLTGQ